MNPDTYRLIVSCPDRVGIVAAVSGFLSRHGGWITEASQHSDQGSGSFFLRYGIRAVSLPFDDQGLRYHLEDRVRIHGNKTVVFD